MRSRAALVALAFTALFFTTAPRRPEPKPVLSPLPSVLVQPQLRPGIGTGGSIPEPPPEYPLERLDFGSTYVDRPAELCCSATNCPGQPATYSRWTREARADRGPVSVEHVGDIEANILAMPPGMWSNANACLAL